MASIGGYSVLSISGLPAPAAHRNVLLERPGVDGASARTEGLRAEETTVMTITFVASAAAAKSTPETYAGLVGSLVTVIDDFGNSLDNVLVQAVRVVDVRRVGVGYPTAYARIECHWDLKRWL